MYVHLNSFFSAITYSIYLDYLGSFPQRLWPLRAYVDLASRLYAPRLRVQPTSRTSGRPALRALASCTRYGCTVQRLQVCSHDGPADPQPHPRQSGPMCQLPRAGPRHGLSGMPACACDIGLLEKTHSRFTKLIHHLVQYPPGPVRFCHNELSLSLSYYLLCDVLLILSICALYSYAPLTISMLYLLCIVSRIIVPSATVVLAFLRAEDQHSSCDASK